MYVLNNALQETKERSLWPFLLVFMHVFFNMRCFFQEVHTDILSSDPSCLIHLAKIRSKQCHYMEKKLLHIPFVSCSNWALSESKAGYNVSRPLTDLHILYRITLKNPLHSIINRLRADTLLFKNRWERAICEYDRISRALWASSLYNKKNHRKNILVLNINTKVAIKTKVN